ncbi:Tropinesterase [Roseivivax sp. THAF40]|uniref:alpha/beta fold hydrolase n=1 Tax=unclassified Roseivivax TaxID=2639302 RepID=UPI001268ECE9|nr:MULTISPECIES: alpha/beta hydrolase [unclassified Roseivivax]QFS81436.1 Tropinesterase [Roseivivax sp. THAF197b]QFT45165.1 Tropinesterase [Roseivivax sp. THAF40]
MIWALAILGALVAVIPAVREARRRPMDAEAQVDAPGDIVTLSQGRTHYRWIGPARGPVAVCVHGLTTPSPAWERLAVHLGTMEFRVLVYDLYGRGFSGAPKGQQSPAFFARQLRDLLDHHGLDEDVTLIGYSMGAVIASAFAVEQPARLRQLVLVAPAGMGLPMGRLQRFCVEWPYIGDWLFHMAYPSRHAEAIAASDAPEDIRAVQQAELHRRGFVPAVLSSLRYALRKPVPHLHKALAQEALPVIAVWGDADRTIPISGLGQLAQWNRRTRQEVIPGADHGLPFTHADALAEVLSGMFEGQRPGPSTPPD